MKPAAFPGFSSFRTSARCGSKDRYNASGATDTPSRHKIFVCRPATGSAPQEETRAPARSSRRCRSTPSAGRRRPPTSASLMEFYQRRADAPEPSTTASKWRCSACSRIRNSSIAANVEPANVPAGTSLSHQRSGAGVAAVVLPVEQHSGRRAARPSRRRAGFKDPAVLEKQVRRMLADPKSRR